jgi:mRNA-degrading endonuclease RelE of RelBE toxin-antitoxin system
MSLELRLKKSAERELKLIKGTLLGKIDKTLLALMENPRPQGSLIILGEENLIRIRCSDFRKIYEVNQKSKQIEVLVVPNRKDDCIRKNK